MMIGTKARRYVCEVIVNKMPLKHVSEFKNLEFVLDELGTDGVECSEK